MVLVVVVVVVVVELALVLPLAQGTQKFSLVTTLQAPLLEILSWVIHLEQGFLLLLTAPVALQ